MQWTLTTVVCLAFVSRCFAQSQTDLQYEGSFGVSSYYGGYLLEWDAPAYTHITIYDRQTKPVHSDKLRGPGGLFYGVWAVDSDGVTARAYASRGVNGGDGRIDILNASGSPIVTINTGAYHSQHLAFAPDHSIWAAGYDETASDFAVLRHYTRSGEKLGESLPWSQIAGDYNALTALQLCLGGKRLFVTSERIGFYVCLNPGHANWIEVSTSGAVLGNYDLGNYRILSYTPQAVTEDGGVYARISKETRFDGWAVLDRSKGMWHKVSVCPKCTLIGSDKDNLIFSQQNGGWTVLHSVPATSLAQREMTTALHE